MAKTPLALTIAGTGIRQDDHGRYSLNDLHKAAGGSRRFEPNRWLRLDQTQALIREMENYPDLGSLDGAETTGIPVVSTAEGRRGGTFVAKELVYSYAMWISPAFTLKVIRTFDAVATGKMNRLFVLPRPEDDMFRAQIKLKDKLTLMAQAQDLSLKISKATDPAHRRLLWVQLVYVNNTLGIQTETMEAMGIEAPRLEGGAS